MLQNHSDFSSAKFPEGNLICYAKKTLNYSNKNVSFFFQAYLTSICIYYSLSLCTHFYLLTNCWYCYAVLLGRNTFIFTIANPKPYGEFCKKKKKKRTNV